MEPVEPGKSYFSPETYDLIRQLVQIVLPAIATLYFTLSNVWGWPREEQVMGTLAAITVFLGILLTISRSRYNNSETRFVGETYLAPTDEGWKRVFNVTADEIDPNKKEIAFKVIDSQSS